MRTNPRPNSAAKLLPAAALMSALLLALLLPPAPAPAQGNVVIYRCTDAAGALTVQNDRPCPKGSRQDKRTIQEVRRVAAPPASASTRRPTASAPAPVARVVAGPPVMGTAPTATITSGIALPDRLPPPVLFECRTYDNDRYLSDDGTPPQRCAPLATTGIGGISGTGAGESCQMVNDQCQRVADGGLCEAWKQRLLEADSALRFGRGENRQSAQAEFDRVERVVRESTCG